MANQKPLAPKCTNAHPQCMGRAAMDDCTCEARTPESAAPGPLKVKGGIDHGSMWDGISIGPAADPLSVAMGLKDSFNAEWIAELAILLTGDLR